MERFISMSKLTKAVTESFESNKDDKLALSVVLTDGRKINLGKTDVASAIGDLVRLPIFVSLLAQKYDNNDGMNSCCKACECGCKGKAKSKPEIPLNRRGLRMLSAVEPTNDSDGKYNILYDNIVALSGAAPDMDEKVYKEQVAANQKADIANTLAAADYFLFDDTDIAVDVYTRLNSLAMTTEQLAVMGATVAADGRNPVNGSNAFDGKISTAVMAVAAAHGGPHHLKKQWMIKIGLPSVVNKCGTIVAMLPGFGAIAVSDSNVNDDKVSCTAIKTIQDIAVSLGLNVYSSARVSVDKD